MIIVVDGYNILKQISPRQVTEKERIAFIAKLSKYGRLKHHEMVVVFDGGPSDWVYKERIGGVWVIYSGPHQSADDVIKEYLKNRKTDDIILVSNDRELKQRAAQLSLQSLEALYFYSLVKGTIQEMSHQAASPTSGLVKLTQEDNPELDELMGKSTTRVATKREDVAPSELTSRKSAAHTLSKEERKIQKKLKKL